MVSASPQKNVSATGNGRWVHKRARSPTIHASSHRCSGSVMSMSKLNAKSITW